MTARAHYGQRSRIGDLLFALMVLATVAVLVWVFHLAGVISWP